MRPYRITVVILGVVIAMYIPTLLIGPLQLLSEGKLIPLSGIAIILGFALPIIALPFLWNIRKVGLAIIISSTLLVFYSALLAPGYRSAAIVDKFIYAFSFSMIHIVFSLISLGAYAKKHSNSA